MYVFYQIDFYSYGKVAGSWKVHIVLFYILKCSR